jgi:hypothetical protein
MWTCGIDMATQQAIPAMHNSAISAFEETPSVPSLPAALAWEAAECCDGARRRSSSESGISVTTQMTPIQI